MLLRYPIQGNYDWCCATHKATPIGENDVVGPILWTRCVIAPRHYTDDEVKELLAIPPELNDVTELFFGETPKTEYEKIPRQRAARGSLTQEEKDERRRAYHRAYYQRTKD